MLISIFANAGSAFGNGPAYAVMIVDIIIAFYRRKISFLAGWLLVITTQVSFNYLYMLLLLYIYIYIYVARTHEHLNLFKPDDRYVYIYITEFDSLIKNKFIIFVIIFLIIIKILKNNLILANYNIK